MNISGAAWGTFLLPYCEFRTYYNLINFNFPMTDATAAPAPNNNLSRIQVPLKLSQCPTAGNPRVIGVLQNSRGCNGMCTTQKGTAPPVDFQRAGWPAPPKSSMAYPVTGDGGPRTTRAAVSNYVGNAGAWMADGNVQDINSTPVYADAIPAPAPPDFSGVLFERSRIRISDIADGISSTALIAEHAGATCVNQPAAAGNLSAGGGTECYAYWANADSFVGDMKGTTVASDVVFSSANGVNGGNNLIPGTSTGVGIPGDISSLHPGGAQIALCDGSVRFLNAKINQRTLQLICQRNDGQSVIVPPE